MNSQYFKVAIRRISRNYKSNLLIFMGLVVGFTSCLILYTKIKYELSFDNYHSQSKNIYRIVRVTSGLEYTNGGLEYRTGVHFPLPAALKRSIPDLKDIVSMMYMYGQKIIVPSKNNDTEQTFSLENGVVLTEPSFFTVFDFGKGGIKWLRGQGKEILDKPFTAVITENTAMKLFGDSDPVGREMIIAKIRFVVEGVISDLPENTDLPFKVFLSLRTFSEKLSPDAFTNWSSLSDNFQCYVVLNNRSDKAITEQKFKEVYTQNAGSELVKGREFKLQQLSDVHKEGQFGNYNGRTISSGLLLALILIGIFIFLIASFNYSNFFLAETLKQKKQIALKLILGSKPFAEFAQLFTESMLINVLAILVAIQFTVPIIRNLYSTIDIPKGYVPPVDVIGILFIVLLLVSASFLAVIFSVLNLKLGSLSSLLKRADSGNTGNKNTFGKASVILQFIVAQTVIIATLIIIKQIYFINHIDLGYTTDNTIYAIMPDNAGNKSVALSGELLSLPQVKQVSFSSTIPAESHNWSGFTLYINNAKKTIDAEVKSIDTAYLKLYSFEFLAGTNFTSADTTNSVILNFEFLKEIGITDPEKAINLKIDGIGKNGAFVKGIVKDFHSGSIREKMRPCLFYIDAGDNRTVSIKMVNPQGRIKFGSESSKGELSVVKEKWEKIFPGQPFEYTIVNDRIASYYEAEHKAMSLFMLFAFVTIFLCILGILGLSLSMNERRTKEIGLRKVNGARISEIIILLNKNFIGWVLIAFVVAVPVSWFAMHKWLENFAYKTAISWWVFIVSAIAALLIAVVTVSWQSLRAAARNPVEALRYE